MNDDNDGFPPADLEETDNVALVRVCRAIKTLIVRHYDEDCKARGLVFLEAVFGELLAAAVAARVLNAPDPQEKFEARMPQLGAELVDRVGHYLHAIKMQAEQTTPAEGEPGPPVLAPIPDRVM